jgi:phage terminase large subunit-like protein
VKNIATALLKAQQGLNPIHKGKKGYGYTYADLASVLDELTEALNKVGVVIVQSPAKSDKQAACVVTRLIHAESGEEIASEIEVPWSVGNTKMNDAQAYGSAITYAKRYALVSMLGVVTEDDDGVKAAPRKAPPPPPVDQARAKADLFVDAMVDWLKEGTDPHELSGLVMDGFKGTNAETALAIGKAYPDLKAKLEKLGF